MNLTDIANYRLISQQIAGTDFKTPGEIVQWMGAMQAQDLSMAKWAVGTRLPGSTAKEIESSLNRGEILRTHLLRPTWHFVTPGDIIWLLDLTAPNIKSSIRSRQKELELSEKLLSKSLGILEKAFLNKKNVVREELVLELKKGNIPTDNNRVSHLLLWAELEGLVCSGVHAGNKQSYTLLENYVHRKSRLHREEALAKLAGRYFFSHCPATLYDFAWWSGLSVTDARHGIELIRSDLIPEKVDEVTYWLPGSFSVPGKVPGAAFLLPAYDEYLISYRNRDASITAVNHKKAISINGIFRPVIVIGGQVMGNWKRKVIKDEVIIETSFFRIPGKREIHSIRKACEKYGQFLDKKIRLSNGTAISTATESEHS